MFILTKLKNVVKGHPKKSIVFGALTAYGVKYGKKKYDEEQLLQKYCREAVTYGEQKYPLFSKSRHITVLLNPAADGGQAKARFNTYCAPLLHLAGIKVAIVRTEHHGQAKELMSVMEDTDGVVVAGGEGTLSEALTGLLRRDDGAAARLPLGVLPLGADGVTGRGLWGQGGGGPLMEATMAVVRGECRPMHVLRVTPLSEGAEEGEPQPPTPPVFASSGLEWGAYKEAWEKRDKYWYWPGLKARATYVFQGLKEDLSWTCDCDVQFSSPCEGCNTCVSAPAVETQTVAPDRWLSWLLPTHSPKPGPAQSSCDHILTDARKLKERSLVTNATCGVTHTTSLEGVCDVRVNGLNTPYTARLKGHELLLQTGITDTTWREFVREGWSRITSEEPRSDRELCCGSVVLRPRGEPIDKEGNRRMFYINGEAFEVRPISIKAEPNAVLVFAPPIEA